MRLKIDVSEVFDNEIHFKNDLTYIDFKRIIGMLHTQLDRYDILLKEDISIAEYIRKKELYILERSKVGLDIKKKQENVLDKYKEYKSIVNSNMSRELRELQMWDSFFMATLKKSSNFSVPGSGKTSSALGVFAFLKTKGKVNKIVMIGPKNSFLSWKDEFLICFKDKLRLEYFDIQDKKYKNKSQRTSALKFDTGNTNLFLFNYESIKGNLEQIINIIDDKTLLIFDEVHRIKKPNGEQAKPSLELSKRASYIITMTGTPIPNTYTDIYNLLHLNYNDEYKDFFGFDLQQLKSPSENDIANINSKLAPFFCRTSKDDLGVPLPELDNIIKINLSNSENDLLTILLKKYKKNMFKAFIRILQLESIPHKLLESLNLNDFKYLLDTDVEKIEDIDYVDYSNDIISKIKSITLTTKIKECIRLTNELKIENKKIIIWCIFIDTMYLLKDELKKLGISVCIINGKIPLNERESELNKFKNGAYDVLISNPHTLAESVSLHQICHDAIYLEYSYNLTHLLQSKDRIHRLGLNENQYTQYNFIISKGFFEGKEISIDERIYYRLKEKEDIMLKAISDEKLEAGYSDNEDLEIIFDQLFK